MNNNLETSRCSECSRPFIPDPRVKTRQVTCGAETCQRERHAKRCQWLRAQDVDAKGHHYRDVVVPFREQRPWYQRWWRWVREIREEFGSSLAGLLLRLERLVARGRALVQRYGSALQESATTAESAAKFPEVVARLGRRVCELEVIIVQIAGGPAPPQKRDTRGD